MNHPRAEHDPFKSAAARIYRISLYSDLHGVRCLLAIAELVWSITLAIPGDTFARPTYLVMSQVMNELAWALVFLVSAITQISIILRCDYHSRFSTYFAGWNSVLWWFVVVSMYMSVSPPPAAISGEFALALGAGWVWCRSGLKQSGTRARDHGTH